jgi:hypothetical protein
MLRETSTVPESDAAAVSEESFGEKSITPVAANTMATVGATQGKCSFINLTDMLFPQAIVATQA